MKNPILPTQSLSQDHPRIPAAWFDARSVSIFPPVPCKGPHAFCNIHPLFPATRLRSTVNAVKSSTSCSGFDIKSPPLAEKRASLRRFDCAYRPVKPSSSLSTSFSFLFFDLRTLFLVTSWFPTPGSSLTVLSNPSTRWSFAFRAVHAEV